MNPSLFHLQRGKSVWIQFKFSEVGCIINSVIILSSLDALNLMELMLYIYYYMAKIPHKIGIHIHFRWLHFVWILKMVYEFSVELAAYMTVSHLILQPKQITLKYSFAFHFHNRIFRLLLCMPFRHKHTAISLSTHTHTFELIILSR